MIMILHNHFFFISVRVNGTYKDWTNNKNNYNCVVQNMLRE